MKLAYADPPYPGCAHLYADHPDYAGEVDHPALIARLVADYDGWALSTSSQALRDILGMCPVDVRVLIWVKNNVRYAWEPIIVQSVRNPDPGRGHLRDWIHCEPDGYQWRPKPDSYVIGQKPGPLCHWLFEWMGADPDDEFDDLFPGSGNVGRAWQEFAGRDMSETARRYVVYEETGEERDVVGYCHICGVDPGDEVMLVSQQGIAHHAEQDTTDCGHNATGDGWWWRL